MFALTKATAKLSSLNPRAEKHGDSNVPACDLKLEVDVHSSVLDEFHPGLRQFLFRKPGTGEQQDLPLVEGDDLTALNVPNIKPLSLDEDFPGYDLALGVGLESSAPIVLDDVELSKFQFQAKNGGSVTISFSASGHPSAEQIGKLYNMIQDKVDITLTPPKATEELPKKTDAESFADAAEQAIKDHERRSGRARKAA